MRPFRYLVLALLLPGCGPIAPGLQAGLDAAGTVIDTAAVVRARQIGLCGAPQHRLVTPEDMLVMQAEIEALKGDLAAAQGQLTRMAIDRARALPQYPLTMAPMPPLPPPRMPPLPTKDSDPQGVVP